MDGRAVKRFGLMMIAALFGAGVIVGGLTSVEEPGEVAAVAAGSTLELQVTGVAGVPGDASAVAVNLTIVGAPAAGFATLYPCGSARPEASNINYAAGQTIANSAIAKPGVGGKICIYSSVTAGVLVDIAGYFPAGSDYTPIPNPSRILDSRNGIGAPAAALGAETTLELPATGGAGVASDAAAVALNLTIVGAAAPGFATVYPCGATRPDASNINYAAGQTIAASSIAKPGLGGKICIYTYATADVLVDVAGYFPAGSDYSAIPNPTRTLDTRNGIGAPAAALGAGQTLELPSTGVAGVPGDASAVAVNLTIVGAAAPGFATLYPCGQARPEASNINYAAGQTIANSAIVKPGAGGKICIYTYATAEVLIDVSGYFPAGSDYTPIPNPTRVLDTRPTQPSAPASPDRQEAICVSANPNTLECTRYILAPPSSPPTSPVTDCVGADGAGNCVLRRVVFDPNPSLGYVRLGECLVPMSGFGWQPDYNCDRIPDSRYLVADQFVAASQTVR